MVVKSRKQPCDFYVNAINLFFHKTDLFDVLTDEQSNGVTGQQDAKGIAGGVFNLQRFLQTMMAVAGGIDGFGQLVRIDGQQFFRCCVLRKKLQRGLAKGVGKEFLVFRENLIQQGYDLALQVRNRIHDPEAVAA